MAEWLKILVMLHWYNGDLQPVLSYWVMTKKAASILGAKLAILVAKSAPPIKILYMPLV